MRLSEIRYSFWSRVIYTKPAFGQISASNLDSYPRRLQLTLKYVF